MTTTITYKQIIDLKKIILNRKIRYKETINNGCFFSSSTKDVLREIPFGYLLHLRKNDKIEFYKIAKDNKDFKNNSITETISTGIYLTFYFDNNSEFTSFEFVYNDTSTKYFEYAKYDDDTRVLTLTTEYNISENNIKCLLEKNDTSKKVANKLFKSDKYIIETYGDFCDITVEDVEITKIFSHMYEIIKEPLISYRIV
jgi:hypothetical protein